MIERSDQEWVRLLKQDDPQAVEGLWVLLFTVAFRAARMPNYRVTGVDPDDLANPATIAAHDRIRKKGVFNYKFDCPFRAFCVTVVIREILRLMPKQPKAMAELDEELVGASDVPRVLVDEEQARARLRACLDELPVRKYQIIKMLYYDEKTPQAVADLLGIERNNVNVLAHRARLTLKECLQRHGFESSEDVLEM